MNAIEQAIEALQAARMELTGRRIETKLADAEAALQSMQGEAVGVVYDVYDNACAVEIDKPVEIGQKLYTRPAPAVPEKMKAPNRWLVYYEENLQIGKADVIRVSSPSDNHCMLVRRDKFPDHWIENMFYDFCAAMLTQATKESDK